MTMKNLTDKITIELIGIIKTYLQSNSNVKKAWLFGSRSSNKNRENSDIDIAIEFNDSDFQIVLDQQINCRNEINRRISSYNIKLDLQTFSIHDPHIQEYIRNRSIVIFDRS